MRAVLFTTAEYASVSNDGLLSVIGVFDSIQADSLPANAPRMYLVAQFRAMPHEYGDIFQVNFQLEGPDGEQLINLSGAGEVPESEHDLPVLMNQVVTLNNIEFKQAGEYTFSALLNGELAITLPFNVAKMKKPTNKV